MSESSTASDVTETCANCGQPVEYRVTTSPHVEISYDHGDQKDGEPVGNCSYLAMLTAGRILGGDLHG
jgi:hypothetical protein